MGSLNNTWQPTVKPAAGATVESVGVSGGADGSCCAKTSGAKAMSNIASSAVKIVTFFKRSSFFGKLNKTN